jgi:hypothetical protein
MSLKTAAALALITLAVGGPAQSCDIPTASTSGPGAVTGSEYERDPHNPTTGTHFADCRDGNGEYRVIVSAATEYSLRPGQPCPAGPRVPTVRQQDPGLYDQVQSALNAPVPYNGGNPDGPCGSWSASDQADADQMRAAWERCMETHGGDRHR